MTTLVFIALVAIIILFAGAIITKKYNTPVEIEKSRTSHFSKPVFSTVKSNPESDREVEVDRLLKRKVLSPYEQQFIYDFLMETGKEKWRYIKGYEGYYRVSSCGMVESCRFDDYLVPHLTKSKTFTVVLSVNTIMKGYPVHKLVADAFIPNPTGACRVKPKDGNYQNCDVRNLFWNVREASVKAAVPA